MSNNKGFGIVMISIACILLIAGIIGLQNYDNIRNPYRAFQKELQQHKNLQQTQEQTIENEAIPDLKNTAFKKNAINILLLGIDSDYIRESKKMGYRSDSIMVTSVNLDTKEVKMLSIPRDSYTDVPGNKNKDKINHAMAYGGGPQKKGNQYAVKAVEDLLGIDIHYYITIDMDVIKNTVDAIGGVTIEVERNMGYSDCPLEKGEQKLDGDQALIYLRDRRTSTGDFARMEQQQKFMIALFEQIKKNGKLSNIFSVYFKMKNKIFTDLKFEQIGALAFYLKDLDIDNIETFILKGKGIMVNSIYYLEIDRAHMESIIDEHFKVSYGMKEQNYDEIK